MTNRNLLLSHSLWVLVILPLLIKTSSASDVCPRLEDLKYELFGTKTIYGDARKYIQQTDDDDLPKGFDDDSLAEEHKDLVKDDCRPLVFYFIGRHSARFPDGEDIDKYNSDLVELVNKLKASGNKCADNYKDLLEWRSKMQNKHDNLITDLGAREERDIARRFKKIYPEFFDTEKSDVDIGVTSKIRTAQTGVEFLREVDGLSLPSGCSESSLPTNDVDRPSYNLDEVRNAACYKNMIDIHEKPFLEFHKKCDKISGETKIKDPLVDRVKDPRNKKRIAHRVAKKLGLESDESDPPIDYHLLDSIYNTCKFENALKNDSVWCDLFEKKDIEALEYMDDVSTYIKGAYGPKARPKQSCPLVKDLIETFSEATRGSGRSRKSRFYFSHADPMKKLLATFGMFKDDDNFDESSIREFEKDLKAPKKRRWRSSVITPFSANMAFVLYRCEEPGKPVKHKILATVTEQPVKLGGCSDTDCNSEKFFATYDNLRDCDLENICASGPGR